MEDTRALGARPAPAWCGRSPALACPPRGADRTFPCRPRTAPRRPRRGRWPVAGASPRSPISPNDSPSTHRSEHARIARLGVLVFDLHATASHDVERIRSVALPEDRLAGTDDPQLDAAREVREHVLGQVVERRERVDQLRRFDPPGGLESESEGCDQSADPPDEGPSEREQASKDGACEEEAQQDEEDLRAEAPSQRLRISSPKITSPEDVSRPEREDREQDPRDPVPAEAPLLWRQLLAAAELMPEVVLDELQRARTQVRHLDQRPRGSSSRRARATGSGSGRSRGSSARRTCRAGRPRDRRGTRRRRAPRARR